MPSEKGKSTYKMVPFRKRKKIRRAAKPTKKRFLLILSVLTPYKDARVKNREGDDLAIQQEDSEGGRGIQATLSSTGRSHLE